MKEIGHESPISVMIWAGGLPLIGVDVTFKRDAVVVEAMKSIFPGKQADLDRFRQSRDVGGIPAINYVLKKIEAHAHNTGFKQVKICVPESLKWYKKPEIIGDYPKGDMSIYWAAKDPSKIMHLLGPELKNEIERIQGNMRKLYNAIANAEGYTRKGDFYVKKL